VNNSTGDSALSLKSAADGWRIRTDISGNLIFEKETPINSNNWVIKGSISG
jgi:hypothetical protein